MAADFAQQSHCSPLSFKKVKDGKTKSYGIHKWWQSEGICHQEIFPLWSVAIPSNTFYVRAIEWLEKQMYLSKGNFNIFLFYALILSITNYKNQQINLLKAVQE